MAKLWRTLLGLNEVARYGVDDYTADLQNAFYNGQLLGGSTGWSRTEDLETNFPGYIQQIYKANGPIFAIILSRMLLFTEAVFCWWEIGDNGDIGLPAGRQGLEPLEAPWPNAGTAELLARMEQDASLAGNFYAAREGDRLRRLRPDWLTIVLNKPPAEATEVDVEGYWYHPGRHFTAVDNPEPTDSFYLVGECAHWSPIPDPDALYRGMSWLQPVVREVMADKAATVHKQKFFDNGATLGTVISAKENLTQKQFDVWRNTILSQHQGVDRAYRPLFLASPVDVTVQGVSLNQLDFKVTQGAGETRLCAAGGVPPIIVGLSEGLSSATYSNYGMARRKFGDHWARPQWRSAAFALSTIVEPPKEDLRLGVNTNGIAFLREDQKDAAAIQQIKQTTIRGYIDAGFTPESSVAAVDADDRSLLVHSGLVSVQLLPPGTTADGPDGEDVPETARHLPGVHNQKSHGRRRIVGAERIEGADLGRVSDRQLLRVFAEISEDPSPDIGALERVFDEMGRREEAKRQRRNPIARINLQRRSEDDLYRLWNEHANAPAAVAAIEAELDRRRNAAAEERNRPVVSWDQHSPDTPEQRQIDRLVARGASYRDAYADVFGLSADQLASQERLGLVDLERRAGESRRQAVRRAYGEQVHLQLLAAEDATRGHLLSPEGRRAGIDPISLFSGPASRARRYASEDLLRWWADNPRVTYTQFAQQVLTGRSDERLALAGNDRDFGV